MVHYDIDQLIPQRAPIQLVDTLLSAEGLAGTTRFIVSADNRLMDGDNLTDMGLVEHMAQSVSALAGYQARLNGATTPPVGMIGDVRDFRFLRLPLVGEELTTYVTPGMSIGAVTQTSVKTFVGNELIAQTDFKIFIEDDTQR